MAGNNPITDSYIDDIIKANQVGTPDPNKTSGVGLRELIKALRDDIGQDTEAGCCIFKGEWAPPSDTTLQAPLLTAGIPTSTTVPLTWTKPVHTEAFVLQRATNSGFNIGLVTIYEGTAQSFTDTGLDFSTAYFYRVKGTGTGFSDSAYGMVAATTVGSGAPTLLQTIKVALETNERSIPSIDSSWNIWIQETANSELKNATGSLSGINLVNVSGTYLPDGTYTDNPNNPDYPDGVLNCMVYIQFSDHADKVVQLTGLDPDKTYDMEIAVYYVTGGSGPIDGGHGNYTFGGETKAVQAINNQLIRIDFSGKSPESDGTMLLTLNAPTDNYPGYNGFVLKEYSAGQPLLGAPSLSNGSSTSTTVPLSWDQPSHTTDFVLQRATNAGFTTGLTTVYSGAALAFTDTGLTAATTYYYRIKGTASGYTDSNYDSIAATTANSSNELFPFTDVQTLPTGIIQDDNTYNYGTGSGGSVLSRLKFPAGTAFVVMMDSTEGDKSGYIALSDDPNGNLQYQLPFLFSWGQPDNAVPEGHWGVELSNTDYTDYTNVSYTNIPRGRFRADGTTVWVEQSTDGGGSWSPMGTTTSTGFPQPNVDLYIQLGLYESGSSCPNVLSTELS